METRTLPPVGLAGDVPGIVMRGVSWADYEAQLRIIGERRIFVNYDRGVMEVMVPSHPHEVVADFLGLMVDILSEELEIPCEAGGSTTHRREDLEKGVEPDRCFWLGDKAASMLGRRDLDLSVDPSPSLVIEVNYTSSSVDRMGIYAALRVDEVWRYDAGLEFHRLEDGAYRRTEISASFPMLTQADAARFLEDSRTMGRVPWMKAFASMSVHPDLARATLKWTQGGARQVSG
jgi:Uma2 family endonuclease